MNAEKRPKQTIRMKFLFTIVLFFAGLVAVAQVDSAGLKTAMQQLDKALLGKDETVLKQVLHKDVLNDFKSGKLVYNKIENNSTGIINISKKWATVKTSTNAEGTVNGTAFKMTLHIMQVWMNTKKGWQLFARQSAKQG
jgi:hypothetical protein